MSDMDMPRLIREPEAAQILQVSARKLRQLRAAGRIEWVQVGRRPLFTAEQIRAFIDRQTVGTIGARNARSPRERRR